MVTLRRDRYPTVGHQKKLRAETQILNNLASVVYKKLRRKSSSYTNYYRSSFSYFPFKTN